MIRPGIFPEPSGHPSLCGTVRFPLIHFDPRDCGAAASYTHPADPRRRRIRRTVTQHTRRRGRPVRAGGPVFRPKPQSPCPVFPNHPEYAHPRKPESESNEPADSKEKGPTVFDRQAFPSVGVTGFEPATTRPPELNFTFSNKFNELYSSGFHTHSKSCSLPLSGVVAISRVPPVFHAPSSYPIKIEK